MDINFHELPYVIYACFVLHNFCELNNKGLEKTKLPLLKIMRENFSQLFPVIDLELIVMSWSEKESEGH